MLQELPSAVAMKNTNIVEHHHKEISLPKSLAIPAPGSSCLTSDSPTSTC